MMATGVSGTRVCCHGPCLFSKMSVVGVCIGFADCSVAGDEIEKGHQRAY